MGTVTGFIFLGSKITVNGDCIHEIERPLLLGMKAMTNLDIVLKSKHITLLIKVCIVKVMVFPVMYRCESWTMKAECWRTDAFELWCWKRLLRVPWNAKRPRLSVLKEINHEYFGYLMWRANSFGYPDAEKDWSQEKKGKTKDEMFGWHHQ